MITCPTCGAPKLIYDPDLLGQVEFRNGECFIKGVHYVPENPSDPDDEDIKYSEKIEKAANEFMVRRKLELAVIEAARNFSDSTIFASAFFKGLKDALAALDAHSEGRKDG